MSARRWVAALLAMMLGAALINVLPGAPPVAAAQGDAADSAMTLSGKGEFEKLKVTVSQTKNLINQVVTVTWQGGVPTNDTSFSTNFLQIMQCWGDDPGPDRTQCQFGAAGVAGKLTAGAWVRNRQITYSFVDPKETLKLPASSIATVPFWPVGRAKPEGAVPPTSSDFFNDLTSNEIPLARTRADGNGEEFFELQTLRQAPGLGCGGPVTTDGVITGRKCWLVVVPRGSTEVNGTPRSGSGSAGSLDSSPLSQSNWDNRIAFPLEFSRVDQACALGAAERRVVGHELIVDAVSQWQPALCAGSGALYSYTQLSDDVARNLVVEGASPGLALMTTPVPPDQVPSDRPLVYAPVGLSGLVIAFNIERQTNASSSAADQRLNGQRFLSMKLTPRLVAKLLTQSYADSVGGLVFGAQLRPPEHLSKNPLALTLDPEFLALNPEYKGFTGVHPPADALVQLGSSDLTSLLWSWVIADQDARAFIEGTPDEHGMVVNPNNKGLVLPTSAFPRNDQHCVDVVFSNIPGKACALDLHPFFNDMHEAAVSALRGDSGGREPSAVAGSPTLQPKRIERQAPGRRALLAVVDAATADRYDLPIASLVNPAGEFVAPTIEGLLAGVAAMKPSSVPGVLAADPGTTNPAAYPLTALSYAVTSPSTLDEAAGKDYASLVRYAAGPGQQPGVGPGQLPLGMAPLPDPLKAQAVAAAATIEAQAGKNLGGTPTPQPTSAPSDPGTPTGTTTGNSAGTTGNLGAATNSTGTVPNPGVVNASPGTNTVSGGPATTAPGLTQQPVAGVLQRTPPLPAPAVGALLVAILICGALAATSSPVLHSPVMRRLATAVWRRLKKGVMPTER